MSRTAALLASCLALLCTQASAYPENYASPKLGASVITASEMDAKRYERELDNGNILLSVYTDDAGDIARVKDIFKHAAARNVCTSGEAATKAVTPSEGGPHPAGAHRLRRPHRGARRHFPAQQVRSTTRRLPAGGEGNRREGDRRDRPRLRPGLRRGSGEGERSARSAWARPSSIDTTAGSDGSYAIDVTK